MPIDALTQVSSHLKDPHKLVVQSYAMGHETFQQVAVTRRGAEFP